MQRQKLIAVRHNKLIKTVENKETLQQKAEFFVSFCSKYFVEIEKDTRVLQQKLMVVRHNILTIAKQNILITARQNKLMDGMF